MGSNNYCSIKWAKYVSLTFIITFQLCLSSIEYILCTAVSLRMATGPADYCYVVLLHRLLEK